MSEYIVDGAEPNSTVLKSTTSNGYEHEKWLPVREEIVRCRDCVFFTADVSTVDERGEQIATGNLCEWTELWTEPDGFCAWAERRTDDN